MRKILLLITFAIMATFSVKAQVEIKSPHRDLDIKFVECEYVAGNVYFDLVITNTGNWGDTASIGVNNIKTMAFDDLGNGYDWKVTGACPRSGLANQKLNQGNMSRTVMHTFPLNVPMRFRFQIDKVSPDATKFTFVSISFSSLSFDRLNNKNPLEIRNMEWKK